jgi:hypothetical protein
LETSEQRLALKHPVKKDSSIFTPNTGKKYSQFDVNNVRQRIPD